MTRLRASLLILISLIVVRPAVAAPAVATLIAPTGDVVGTTISFSWQSVPDSTWYLFWLGQGNPPSVFVMQQWYTAEQAGCANGGTCTISLTPPLNGGAYTWFVQTWGAGATGPWSTGKVFVVKEPMPNWSGKLPDGRRFTLVLEDQAVLDNETGVIWERTPSGLLHEWAAAVFLCGTKAWGNRKGWRLATLPELLSLVDPSNSNPALPAGHPFSLNLAYPYHSQTRHPDPNLKMVVDFQLGASGQTLPITYLAWCVRSSTVADY